MLRSAGPRNPAHVATLATRRAFACASPGERCRRVHAGGHLRVRVGRAASWLAGSPRCAAIPHARAFAHLPCSQRRGLLPGLRGTTWVQAMVSMLAGLARRRLPACRLRRAPDPCVCRLMHARPACPPALQPHQHHHARPGGAVQLPAAANTRGHGSHSSCGQHRQLDCTSSSGRAQAGPALAVAVTRPIGPPANNNEKHTEPSPIP